MSQPHAVPIPRPPVITTNSGNFRTRSLAISPINRLGSPRSISSESSTVHGFVSGSGSGQDHEGIISSNDYATGRRSSDIEAGTGTGTHAGTIHEISPNSSNTPLAPVSHRSGTVRHRKHKNRHHKQQREEYRWLTTAAGGGTGDEPGVDVKSRRDEEAYGHLKNKTKVTVVDYSSNPDEDNTNLRCEFPGERLREWLDSDHGQRQRGDDGKPTGVRWIHIDGLNWQVIKTLVLHFGLHPLAVEDALRATNTPRSKLDFYRNHLYLQILIHHTTPSDEIRLSIAAEEMANGREDGIFGGGSSSSMSAAERRERENNIPKLPEGVEGVFEPSLIAPRHGGHHTFDKQAHTLTVNELSAKYMVPIRRGILSLFMLRDGTLISMDAKPTREVLAPIYHRLEDESSLLRRSGDVSMLAQAILDVAADLAIEISQTFESELLKLEASVLVNPQMETVRHLHILSSQLIRLRRSLTPLLHLCYIVRDQDAQRSVAASAMVPTGTRAGTPGLGSNNTTHHMGLNGNAHTHLGLNLTPQQSNQSYHFGGSGGAGGMPISPTPSRGSTPMPGSGSLGKTHNRGFNDEKREPSTSGKEDDAQSVLSMFGVTPTQATHVGFFSPMTKVYIGDVIDHLEITVGSLDQFVNTCDHLTDYVFNVLSFQTNESMERLSIVTVVFLPLTFIASYFGMNFDDFDELHQSVVYFWKVAIPCTTAFFVIFSFGYLRAFAETLYRKVRRWRWKRAIGGGAGAGGRMPPRGYGTGSKRM
uniref:Magnesium transporter n=1 Tax=Kwoniella dejecticola CBS 10117 TaxID=1296121 RepID=A0A1A6ADV9_9TREE|nr:uncharacterized protein I303_00034 [Kwoniella dejecticola CBS 10117]OBR88223.1 hypothetical protein I303_00034 [Kwoniella dejecticola CBS 10117]